MVMRKFIVGDRLIAKRDVKTGMREGVSMLIKKGEELEVIEASGYSHVVKYELVDGIFTANWDSFTLGDVHELIAVPAIRTAAVWS